MRCQCASGSPHGRVRAWARAWRRCVRTFWLAPWAVRRARVAPVLHRRLWIDAGCVAGGGGCSIDFARAPASRGLLAGNCPSLGSPRWRGGAIAAWSAANALPVGAAPSAHRRQFTPCNARARGLLRAWARPRGSSHGACQAARPSEPSGGLQAARTGGRPPVRLPQRGAAPRALAALRAPAAAIVSGDGPGMLGGEPPSGAAGGH